MSKYYKAEDVIRAFKEWLAISEAAEDIIADLPTIDAISREHLKSFEYINKGDFNSVETIREWIDNAPSVIPQMPNEDAIGREELIKALIREKSDYLMAWNDAPTGMVKETCDELDKCIAIVINAPSVIPKPKEGEVAKMTKAEFTEFMDWAKEQTTGDLLNTPDNLQAATDIVKALREAEYRGYMKAVAERPQGEVDAVEVYEKAESQLERNEITIGEFEKIVEPLRHLFYNRPQGEWIPCSEKLPEKDGSYLVYMSWNYRSMDVLMWSDGWNCTRRINGEVNRESEMDEEIIIAWMPLPKPWKGASR